MDQVKALIDEFQNNSQQINNVNNVRKLEVINTLENINDSRVLPFFLETVVNEAEYDLARIEILKILRIQAHSQAERNQIAQCLTQILVDSSDDEVRTYAAMALARYADTHIPLDIFERIVSNSTENINLRHAVFSAVEQWGLSEETCTLMNKFLQQPEFKEYAKEVLNRWEVN